MRGESEIQRRERDDCHSGTRMMHEKKKKEKDGERDRDKHFDTHTQSFMTVVDERSSQTDGRTDAHTRSNSQLQVCVCD